MKNTFSTIQKLAKTGLFHIFGSGAINKIVGFLSSIVLVRLLSKNEYGIFTYAWNIYSIVLLFNGFGIESGTLQIASERNQDSTFVNNLFGYSLKYGMKASIAISAVLLCIGFFAPLKIENSRGIIISLFALPMVQLVFDLTLVYFRSQKQNKKYARLSLINTSLVFILSIVGALLCREIGLVIGRYFAFSCSSIIAFLILHVKFLYKEHELDYQEKKALLSISAVSMCNNGLSQLLYLLDVFVLGIVAADETILASYKVATLIPTALSFIPQAFVTYIYPYFAEHRKDGMWCLKYYKKCICGMGIINLILALLLFLFAPLIIRLLYGTEYLDAVNVFRILSINYFFAGTFRIISGNLLVTQRKLKFNLFVAIISGSVNAIADYYFIKLWGSTGAAYATVLVVLISSVLSTSYLIKTFNKNKYIVSA